MNLDDVDAALDKLARPAAASPAEPGPAAEAPSRALLQAVGEDAVVTQAPMGSTMARAASSVSDLKSIFLLFHRVRDTYAPEADYSTNKSTSSDFRGRSAGGRRGGHQRSTASV